MHGRRTCQPFVQVLSCVACLGLRTVHAEDQPG
jgi:hypothetical protein